ncbi:MAG: hypothetical protein CBB87_03385 [Micavibrio sp. TMED27]|nr:hypothetical protein [Micavibrio sp.]OUT91874.1 MAG: hypothetical protein CBB87_03385 [Micavibrio sp. TMED27]|tara:strand:- start:752 stop:1450 length:699 start_codon:yes stop_codon:yes gene_type:complete
MKSINTHTTLSQIKTFFNAVGKDFKTLIDSQNFTPPVVIISGDGASGKSAVSDYIMLGSLGPEAITNSDASFATTRDRRTFEDTPTSTKDWQLGYIMEDAYDAERIYECWKGNNLSAFFCNSAVLPKDRTPEVIETLLNSEHNVNMGSLPESMDALYHATDARDLLSREFDMILITNPGHSQHLKADLDVTLYFDPIDMHSDKREMTINVDNSTPLGQQISNIIGQHLPLLS